MKFDFRVDMGKPIQDYTYRVIGNSGPKVIAYCSQNMKIMDFLTPLGAAQMWSI